MHIALFSSGLGFNLFWPEEGNAMATAAWENLIYDNPGRIS
jgi:hypothetical protein